MSILFHSTFINNGQWLKNVRKKFNGQKIFTFKDKPNYDNIHYAIVWNLPDKLFVKLKNLRAIFSLGAGVEHILNLPSYKDVPIIRLKDPAMADSISNHVLSQILNYQLKLEHYRQGQKNKVWRNDLDTYLNDQIQVGILGVGVIGTIVGQNLKKLNYNVVGFKNTPVKKKSFFQIYAKNKLNDFIKSSDIIVSILPSTVNTTNFINKNFLRKMKKKSLLINVGRGASINEKHLINHLKLNKGFYASLDVFKEEPLPKKHPLWSLKNVIITPHISGATDLDSALEQIYNRWLKIVKTGKIISDVNLKKGY
ncbi:NAD(P)-binding domain-containing protein [Alphaproteobacteria bacterium]|nr:NAD(P)-binding domain-containing protein [Alphaproteobacteria bacterium]